MGTVTVLGQTMDTVIVLHRWTLTMSTITLSSTGQLPLGLLMLLVGLDDVGDFDANSGPQGANLHPYPVGTHDGNPT